MSNRFLIAFLFLVASLSSSGQALPIDVQSTSPYLSKIGAAFNRIFNEHQLDSIYAKLASIKKNKTGVLRIVHIGDSHVQAGYFTGETRTRLQDHFGNSGRGLVFPYKAIQTTSPADISSSSNGGWKTDKVATTGDADNAGISGYGMRSGATGASIDIRVGTGFNRLRFFLGEKNSWIFRSSADNTSLVLKPPKTGFTELVLDKEITGFNITSMPGDDSHDFYGVSLENRNAGIIYHSIGVNGARYDQYNKASLFWKQLPGLQADLYIVSLGTNEAQRSKFEEKEFRKELDEFLQKLKKASPNAKVILTTAPDSYRNGRPNVVLRDFNLFLFEYCTQKSIPVWDLYRVTNGYGAASSWIRKGLMNADRVHYTAQGYQIQGTLFYNALARGYNSYNGF